jgi:ABC-type Fe3+ transport system substrate-binding protein
VLNADWVKPEEAQAARKFMDYLASKPAQELALLKYGFRPVEPTIPLDQADSLFNRYKANGLTINLPPQVEVPSGDVLNTLLDFWSRAARK